MSNSWQALRATDREMACCLLFVSAKYRPLLADLFSLGGELETAIQIPSEIMLAAIRLQWWFDAVSTDTPSPAPLMARLQNHLKAGALTRKDLHDIIGLWQDRLAVDPDDMGACWAGLFGIIVRLQGRADLAHLAGLVGAALSGGRGGPDQSELSVDALRKIDGAALRWLGMAGYLALYRQDELAGPEDHNQAHDHDDPLLVWRMLGWRWGIRLPSSARPMR